MPTASLRALKADAFDFRKAQHLLNRAGLGGSPEQVRALADMGLIDAVDHLLEYDGIEGEPVNADDFDSSIMTPLNAAQRRRLNEARRSGDEATVEQYRRDRQRRQRSDRRQMSDIQQWWLRRMIGTRRPLEEKMTLFWHGHFATGYRAIEDSYHMFLQNQLFRSHATGNFRQLTHAIIRDPAMLRYLNNNQNRKQRPNENLARELMELFTLGEGHGYGEDDIKEAARALTGYTFDDDAFVFRPRVHDDKTKRILGATGPFNGDDLVEIILSMNYASEFICYKLYRFFVNDLPNGADKAAQSFILKLARRFRESRYDLRPVLRTLLRSEHFHDDANIAAQIKSPIQLIVQAIRSLGTPRRDIKTLLAAADLMGQAIFHPPSVKGWDGGRSWINTSTLFVRQNIMVYLLTGRLPESYGRPIDEARYDPGPLVDRLAGGSAEPRDAAERLLMFCLGREPRPERMEALMAYLERRGGVIDSEALIGLLSLIAAMPEYQLC